ncbi:unnamed protein product, partial [Staurois parvus]
MTEWGQCMLKRTVRRSHQLSAELITKDLQTSCGLQISITIVCIDFHKLGFHGQAAAFKPYIAKCNIRCQMQWHKAHCHW